MLPPTPTSPRSPSSLGGTFVTPSHPPGPAAAPRGSTLGLRSCRVQIVAGCCWLGRGGSGCPGLGGDTTRWDPGLATVGVCPCLSPNTLRQEMRPPRFGRSGMSILEG